MVSGGLNHLLEKSDKFGCVERLASNDRPWSTHNAENIDSVHSEENRSSGPDLRGAQGARAPGLPPNPSYFFRS